MKIFFQDFKNHFLSILNFTLKLFFHPFIYKNNFNLLMYFLFKLKLFSSLNLNFNFKFI
jgi:hypothetical protein